LPEESQVLGDGERSAKIPLEVENVANGNNRGQGERMEDNNLVVKQR
jgi:hypothetical protein